MIYVNGNEPVAPPASSSGARERPPRCWGGVIPRIKKPCHWQTFVGTTGWANSGEGKHVKILSQKRGLTKRRQGLLFAVEHIVRIVLIGARGRLGTAMARGLTAAGHGVVGLTRSDLDITNAEQVGIAVQSFEPDVVVNCSAYNAVDAAEADPGAAFAANAQGPLNLARAAEAAGALLVHFSTDFVFDGTASRPYTEVDSPNPLSVYGASKLAGEYEVINAASRHYVLRVESLFGGCGTNGQRATIDYLIDSLLTGATVRAMVDRTVSLSYVDDVVSATAALMTRQASAGIYHCVNSGWSTWYDLAVEIARQLDVAGHIEPVLAADVKVVARRPLFCALSNDKLRRAGISMPGWQTAIARHLTARAIQLSG
jgi:dTDP-4-dehydrorhamnose reductase